MTEIFRPSLTLVTDRNLYRQEAGGASYPLSLVEAAIAGGVDIVQLRVKTADINELGLYAIAMRVRELTDGKALFVLTGDIELAEKCRADGILLAERSYKPSEARNYLRGESRLVGVFVQSVVGASRAERADADYVQVGPPFSEEDETGITGLAILRKIKDAIHIPVVAFGGIKTAEQATACLAAGADGIAVTDAITQADDPQAAAAALRAAINASWDSRHDGA